MLAYFDEGGLFKLAESLPEFDCLVGGPTGQAMKPAQVGPVTVLTATNKGKFLAGLRATAMMPSSKAKKGSTDKPWSFASARPLEVKSDLPEDAKQLKILENFRKQLQGRDFRCVGVWIHRIQPQSPTRLRHRWIGQLLKCHQADQDVWHNTKHAHAWEVLVPKNAISTRTANNVIRLGMDSLVVFIMWEVESRIHVGCENCHGPLRKPSGKSAKENSLPCQRTMHSLHDHENSPEFAYPAFWSKVKHGKILQQ